MKLKCIAAAAYAALLTACAATGAVGLFQDFKVNGETVTAGYQQGLFDDQMARGQTDTQALRSAVKALAVEHFALTQATEKTGLTDDPAVLRRIDAARVRILAQALSEKELRAHPLTENDLQAAYQKLKADYGPSEYHVRQIFVDNETDEKALEEKLTKRPASFARLAKDANDNKVLADRAGDMGWVGLTAFAEPTLRDAVKTTKAGTNSALIRTQAVCMRSL